MKPRKLLPILWLVVLLAVQVPASGSPSSGSENDAATADSLATSWVLLKFEYDWLRAENARLVAEKDTALARQAAWYDRRLELQKEWQKQGLWLVAGTAIIATALFWIGTSIE